MNQNGSGVTWVKTSMSDEMKLFNGGIRSIPQEQTQLELNRSFINDQHENFDYVRGTVVHSRSPTTKFLEFHGLYGGLMRDVGQRVIYQNFYKRILRPVWVPCSMRMYDNRAYDYYYFSD